MSVQETLCDELRKFKCRSTGSDSADVENVFWEVQAVATHSIPFVHREDMDRWHHVCECDHCWRQLQETMLVLGVDVETQDRIIDEHARTRERLRRGEPVPAPVPFDPFAAQGPDQG